MLVTIYTGQFLPLCEKKIQTENCQIFVVSFCANMYALTLDILISHNAHIRRKYLHIMKTIT